MTRVGNYTYTKTDAGFVLSHTDGTAVGTFPTARAAMEEGIRLTAKAYKARTAV